MAKNKIIFGGAVLLDLSEDTVTPEAMLEGVTAHDRSGVLITGTLAADIPAAYRRVEYIRSNGKTAYIDTGLTLDGAYSIEAEGSTADNSAGILFDAYESSNMRLGGIFYNRASPRYDRWWPGVGYYQQPTSGIDLGQKLHIIQNQGGVAIIQGGVMACGTYSGTTGTSSVALWLFASQRSDLITNASILYWIKISKNGSLLRDMVPVVRLSDSAAGMWDKVSKTFFGTAGTGRLIAGPSV